jgi:hypothetical protein
MSLRFFPKLETPQSFYSLPPNGVYILGLTSHGNVGQIAVDSLLALARSQGVLTSIGCLESIELEPVSGCEYYPDYLLCHIDIVECR